jgi:predicted ArsR family transcriptional regulator
MDKPTKLARTLGATRGRVVMLLRRGICTVNDLAAQLKLTDNAVRAQLATLERDGLVHAAGERPGHRKPHVSYALTRQGEQLFPGAFDLILSEFLGTLDGHFAPEQIAAMMRETGRRLRAKLAADELRGADLKTRARQALRVIEEIGGLADLEATADTLTIRGLSCPVASLVVDHPQVCELVETLLSELLGVKVVEHCEKRGTPRCRFEMPAVDPAA